MEEEILSSFAEIHSFSLFRKMDIREKESIFQLFKNGLSHTVYNYMVGYYRNKRIELYFYSQTFGYDDAKEIFDYIIIEIKTKRKLPQVIIAGENTFLEKISFLKYTNFVELEKLTTESNEFNNFFKIFLKKDNTNQNEINALEVINPDFMLKMIALKNKDFDHAINIEMNGNNFILYKSKSKFSVFSKKLFLSRLEQFLDIAVKIAEEIDK